jgi:hypothetical protein
MEIGNRHQYNLNEPKNIETQKRIMGLKALLKEEESQKLNSIIDRIESTQEVIDKYVVRITRVEAKVIRVIRNWHRLLKEIIIEEGREVLDLALEELEQELKAAEKLREKETKCKKDCSVILEEKPKEIVIRQEETKQTETSYEKEIFAKARHNKDKEKISTMKRGSYTKSLITQEVEAIREKATSTEKRLIEILFETSISKETPQIQEETERGKITEGVKNNMQTEELKNTEDLSMRTYDVIFEEIEDSPLGKTQIEINDPKEYWKRQLEHAVITYKEPRGSTLEESEWAPNEKHAKV